MTGPMAGPTITKNRSDAPSGFFALEAAGLRWLAGAGDSDHRAAPVAGVVDVGEDFIVLERLSERSATRQHAAVFGRRLAVTHDAGASGWGAPPSGVTQDAAWIGDLPQRNKIEPSWGAMYAEHRVLQPARIAHQQGNLSDSDLADVERLAERLHAGEFDDEAAPARIHGDLWSGNVICTDGGMTMIDPAAHGGHRITDLAMLDLFASPYLSHTWDAYAETSTNLPDRWRELIELHQVHPLLVHTALFGGGYARQAMAAVRRYR